MTEPGSTAGGAKPTAMLPVVAEFSFSLTPFFIATTAVVLWVLFFAMGAIVNSQPYRDYLNAATVPAAAVAPIDVKDRPAALPGTPRTTPEQTRAAVAQLLSLTGFFSLFMVIVTYTPPNIAILAALSALVGAAARWMTDETSTENRRRLLDGRRSLFARRRRARESGEDAGSIGAEFESISQELRSWASGVLLSALARGFFVYLSILSGLLVLTGDPFDSPTPGQYFRLAGTTSLFCFIVGWQPNFLAGLINRFAAVAQAGPGAQTAAKTVTVSEAVTTTQTTAAAVTAPVGAVLEPKAIGDPALLGTSRPRLDN